MSVAIRLAKFGKKNAPSYRIVVISKRASRQGKALEIIGSYNPSHQPTQLTWKKERLNYWQKQGAQLSKAIEKLVAGEYVYKKYSATNGGAGRREKSKKL